MPSSSRAWWRNGYEREFAERCFGQIEGFGEYGFPESHAASFALLVYVSSWIKRYYPETFCAALLNSQPMGFYAPAQLVRDAREHGVEVRPPRCEPQRVGLYAGSGGTPSPRLRGEGWGEGQEHTPTSVIAAAPHPNPLPVRPREYWDGSAPVDGPRASGERESRCAVRLGLRLVDGLAEEPARRIVSARGAGYASVGAVWLRSGAPVSVLERLADADAFRSTGLDRRAALWAVKGLDGGALHARARRATAAASPMLAGPGDSADLFDERPVALPSASLGEHVVADYAALGLSLKAHPVAFFRDELSARGILTSAQHWEERLAGRRVTVAGLVLVRQRPGTAKGVIFLTLEDETGIVNVVVWPKVFETQPPRGDDRAVPGRTRQDPARGPRHPRGRRGADRPHPRAASASATAPPPCRSLPRTTATEAAPGARPGRPKVAIFIDPHVRGVREPYPL